MERPRQILVVIDPTATRHPALTRAKMLAHAFRARVELFVCHVPRAASATRVDELRLEALANGLREQGIETATDESSDNSFHAGILRKVLDARPSLVVKDTHPHSLLRRSVLANTDWQLIRLCPVPLLFVKAGDWGWPPHIAAAVDVSLPGEKPAALDHLLLSAAESFALATRGHLHAVHAYLPTAALPMATLVSPLDLGGTGEVLERGQFDELLATHAVPPGHRHLIARRTSEALVDCVREWGIDLLVMGAIARGWMYNAVVGSTTERVLDLLPCDVLVLKPASFECPLNWAASGDQPTPAGAWASRS